MAALRAFVLYLDNLLGISDLFPNHREMSGDYYVFAVPLLSFRIVITIESCRE